MPTYDYACSECKFEFETVHGMKDEDFLKTCPECFEDTLKIVYYTPPDGFVKGDPKTLGLLADRNRSAMSHQQYEDKIRQDKEDYKAKIQARKEMMPLIPGETRPDPSSFETPIWRPGTTKPNMKLANLTKQQTENYIVKGTT